MASAATRCCRRARRVAASREPRRSRRTRQAHHEDIRQALRRGGTRPIFGWQLESWQQRFFLPRSKVRLTMRFPARMAALRIRSRVYTARHSRILAVAPAVNSTSEPTASVASCEIAERGIECNAAGSRADPARRMVAKARQCWWRTAGRSWWVFLPHPARARRAFSGCDAHGLLCGPAARV